MIRLYAPFRGFRRRFKRQRNLGSAVCEGGEDEVLAQDKGIFAQRLEKVHSTRRKETAHPGTPAWRARLTILDTVVSLML